MPAPPAHPPALPDEQVGALVTAPVHAPVPRNRLQTPSWASGTTDCTETPAESQRQFLPVLSPGFMALPEIFPHGHSLQPAVQRRQQGEAGLSQSQGRLSRLFSASLSPLLYYRQSKLLLSEAG